MIKTKTKQRSLRRRPIPLIMLLIAVLLAGALGSCSLVKEGITGEKPEADEGSAAVTQTEVPAAYPIIGDWFGVYGGTEYLSFRFTADGKCELQTAQYASDMYGPRYYGDYIWGGDNGNEIYLDLYKGDSKEVDYGEGFVIDEWYDGGREAADTALTVSFEVYGSADTLSFALKSFDAAIDTSGYTVIRSNTFVVLLSLPLDGSGNPTPYVFGSQPFDATEGKNLNCTVPDILSNTAQRYYTTDDLNVRCGPGTENGSYGTVAKNTVVNVIGHMAGGPEDWVFVLLGEGGGWVNTDYLSETAEAEEPADGTDTDME